MRIEGVELVLEILTYIQPSTTKEFLLVSSIYATHFVRADNL